MWRDWPASRRRPFRGCSGSTRYEPNAAARAFRTRRSGAIGVVVARLSYQLYPAMLESIGARLAGLGQRMIVWDSEYGGDLPASQALRQGIVDGVILTASTRESEFLNQIASPQAPVVLINRTVDGYPSDQVSKTTWAEGGASPSTCGARAGSGSR